MKKIYPCLFLSLTSLLFCYGCKSQESLPADNAQPSAPISLTVWGGEEDEALLEEIFTSFQSHYADQATFQITYQPQSESSCKDALLENLEGGADVFAFADDQVAALAAAGALDPI